MLTAKRNGRKIHAMMMKEPVDKCLGVVQCGLPGCEAYMPLIVDAYSPGDQCDWFLDNHECRTLPGTRKPKS